MRKRFASHIVEIACGSYGEAMIVDRTRRSPTRGQSADVGKRDGVYADLYEITDLRQKVRDVAVDGRENARAPEIHLRLAQCGIGLSGTRLGAHALRLQQLDLPLHFVEIFSCSQNGGLLLMQLRCELLGILNGAPAIFRQSLLARCLLLCEHVPCLRLMSLCLAGADPRLLDSHLRVDILDGRLRLLCRRLGLTDGDCEVGRVDLRQQITLGVASASTALPSRLEQERATLCVCPGDLHLPAKPYRGQRTGRSTIPCRLPQSGDPGHRLLELNLPG